MRCPFGGDLTVYFASSIFSEDSSPEIAISLAWDYQTMEEAAGVDLPRRSFYVVLGTPTGDRGMADGDRGVRNAQW